METTNDTTKILGKGPEYLRKQMDLESETKGRMSAVERLAASKPKYVKRSDSTGNTLTVHISSPVQAHRSSAKKRPDSLLIYRQKCELLRGPANERKHHITRKLLLNPVNKNAPLPEGTDKECESQDNMEKITTPKETAKECYPHVVISKPEIVNASSGLTVPEVERRSGKGVSRSHSDISSRYSKNFADFDAFFKYCGLDGEVIESLGKENFSARSDEIAIMVRSVSVSTSDDGFSRNSSDSDGLMEEKLHEKIRQETSVIERNARIIKWLYSCKNASDTGKKLRDLH
uniref:Family with sequence similarity 110 member C n=1 Tax=Oreochromis niloticus TaxID=8128 RepID=A0A669AYP2_ORENI